MSQQQPAEPSSLMAEEIAETPTVIGRFLRTSTGMIAEAAAAIAEAEPTWVCLVARGTSDHAAIYARYLIESKLGIPVSLGAPSLTAIYDTGPDWRGALVIAISQSGRSSDLIATTGAARSAGALTICVTNAPLSPLASSCDRVIDYRAGPERSVAATKTYVASLVALATLVESIVPSGLRLDLLPQVASQAVEAAQEWVATTTVVDSFAAARGALVVGRGFNMATAQEVALKLIETSGRLALGYSSADAAHGPTTLASEETPVLVFDAPGPASSGIAQLSEKARSQGAQVWTVTTPPGRADGEGERTLILGDPVAEPLSSIPLVLAGQILAEATAHRLGRDPDRPLGLDKVTVTL